jgi:NAD(P)-dependent dehydrogenase (short-subunit alcohol dehydrogenase family)
VDLGFKAASEDVFVVTGASSGVGSACVDAIVSAGGRVAGLDIRAPATGADPAVLRVACDVRSVADLALARDRIEGELGTVTHLVHSAARFTGMHSIDDYTDAEVADTIGVNLVGSINVARTFVPSIRRRPGAVVFLGSVVGGLGAGRDSVYAATKAAVHALAKSLAVEEAASGLRVNVVVPGNILTPQRVLTVNASSHPAELDDFYDRMAWTGKSAESAEIARTVMVLLSDGFPSLTGALVHVTGAAEVGIAPKQTFEQWLDRS